MYKFTINEDVFTFSHAWKWLGLDTDLCTIVCGSMSYIYLTFCPSKNVSFAELSSYHWAVKWFQMSNLKICLRK